jgi:hypothetical protein
VNSRGQRDRLGVISPIRVIRVEELICSQTEK